MPITFYSKRTSVAGERPQPGYMNPGEILLNIHPTTPSIFLKDSTGNIIRVGPAQVSATAPNLNPPAGGSSGNSVGELWYDNVNNVLKLYDGENWVPAIGSPGAPVGTIQAFGGTTAPDGFLLCNGAAVSRTTYSALFAVVGTAYGAGNGTTTFNVPDFRGEFLRGNDNGRGVDAGRVLGSAQDDAFESHTHTYGYRAGLLNQSGSDTPVWVGDSTGTTGATGGSETRPRNVTVNYIIKT